MKRMRQATKDMLREQVTDAVRKGVRIGREAIIDQIETIMAEFGDMPEICLAIIQEHISGKKDELQ